MKKKFLSIAVCLCMIMTMIPGGVLQPDEAWAAEHTPHCVCGGSTAIGDHTAHNLDAAWIGVSNLTDITQAGNYYLTDNVTLTETWKPVDGVALCLNGYDIQAKGSFDVITIEDGVTFTVTECSSSTQGKITHTSGSGRGILVNNTAVFNMYGGDVTGNSCSQEGAGVNARGIFNMYGGSITGNTMTADYNYSGGGVCVGSTYSGTGETRSQTFNMYGGSISQNKSRGGGGGVDIGSGTFNLHNGSIAKNESKTAGGGVYAGHQKLNMYGGSITENSCSSTSVGGGVYVGQYYWEDANLTVSGNVTIENNKKGETPNNVYLQSPSNYITVIGIGEEGLDRSARIGVSTSETPATKGIKIVEENDADYSANFFSDEGYYVNYNSSKQLELLQTKPGHEHPVCGKTCSHTSAHSTISASEWKPIATGEELNAISEAGCYYLTDDVILTGKWKPANNVVLCLNGYDIICNAGTYDHSVSAIDIGSNDTLVLTDCHTGSEAGKVTHGKDSSDKRFMGRGVSNHGTFIMYNISIADNDNTSKSFSGGGIENNAGATFTMYNGSITRNKDVNGGGVYNNYGTFNMYGGTISGNTASNNGGGVFNAGKSDSNAVFNMYGGTVKGNAALSTGTDFSNGLGGGVCNAGSFNMHGGVIGGTEAADANIASNRGGGIYDGRAYYDSNPVFNISGAANIIGNKVNTKDNNLYLYNQENTVTVTADGLEEGARIGVSSFTEPSDENPVIITSTGRNAVYFFSDDNSCEIGSDSDNAVILKKKNITHEHTWDTAWKHDDTHHWHKCTGADCTEINDKAEHTGGIATCTEKAVCSVCNTPYGKVSGHEFGGEYKYSAAGHWQECQHEGCTETSSITDHVYDNNSDTTCNTCDYVRTVTPGYSGKTDNVTNRTEDKNAGTAASTTATIKPSTTTSGEKKTTTATVDNTTANKILDKAVSNKSTEVIINTLTRAGISEAQAGTATEIALPEKTVRELSEKTEASLIIRADAAEITLDKKAVDGLAAQAGTDGYVRLIVEIVKQDSNTLEAELKLVTSKGTVTDFKGGNVSVMVKLNDTLAAKDLVCVYIDDSNIYHMVNGAKNSDGTYSFMTGHFSTYAVMARSEAEKVIAEQNADKATELVKSVKLKARSAKTAKGNIRVTLSVANGRDSIKALEDLGYTVKYKYYRSTSRAKNYKSMLEGTGKTYINAAGKKGTKYFYKARLTVYDAQGRLIAKTELKQCRYACRVK